MDFRNRHRSKVSFLSLSSLYCEIVFLGAKNLNESSEVIVDKREV